MFIDRVKDQLHIVLAMSPIGEALRTRLRKFPSLVNCCTIDWFQSWPDDALASVATKFLEDVEMDEKLKVALIFGRIYYIENFSPYFFNSIFFKENLFSLFITQEFLIIF